jgi:hypothetical protein
MARPTQNVASRLLLPGPSARFDVYLDGRHRGVTKFGRNILCRLDPAATARVNGAAWRCQAVSSFASPSSRIITSRIANF